MSNLKFFRRFAVTTVLCLFVLASGVNILEAALPESGIVDNLYGIKWEKPHFKKNKIYLTLKNETAVFQALSVTALFVDSDGQVLAEAPFEVGLGPGKSIRAFSILENRKDDLDKSVQITWE